MPATATHHSKLLRDAPALNHADQYHDDRKDQERVNQSAHRVRRDHTEQPQDDEDDY